MTNSPDTWPPAPSKPIERGEWDDFIEAEMIDMPVDDGLRRGRLMLALRLKAGLKAHACRHVITDYYRRYGLVDPKYKLKWTCFAWLGMLGFLIVVLIADIALLFYNPQTRIEAHREAEWRHLLVLVQLLISILITARAMARLRELKAKRNQEPQ